MLDIIDVLLEIIDALFDNVDMSLAIELCMLGIELLLSKIDVRNRLLLAYLVFHFHLLSQPIKANLFYCKKLLEESQLH